MLISALVLPLSILHSQLTQRRRYVSAAYKSPPQWTIDDLNTILSNMRYILSSCDGADKLTGKHSILAGVICQFACVSESILRIRCCSGTMLVILQKRIHASHWYVLWLLLEK